MRAPFTSLPAEAKLQLDARKTIERCEGANDLSAGAPAAAAAAVAITGLRNFTVRRRVA